MNPRWILLLCLSPLLIFGQAPATVKQAPPPGISVPVSDAEELHAKTAELAKEIESVRASLKPDLASFLPDVEIFEKAARDALEYNEFFKRGEIASAKGQLEIGLRRAAELRDGAPGWVNARGPLVRAYRSRIDDSVQPYGLIVPEDWRPGEKKARPLYLWFHGRNDTLSEVAFIAGQLKAKREFAPSDSFELHVYGRYCNASKFAGEVDAFEALADVMRQYSIDTNRLAELGFSMGGATAWHIAAHYPGEWAVASAGAGFAETAIYAKVFAPGKPVPPPWEQKLWRWYDATDYAANFANFPMIAYSGEIDPQKQSADIMEKAMADEGLKLERLIGPKTAHKYEPETKKELSRRIQAYMEKGRDPFPRQIRFVTYTLRYNRMKWVTLDELEKHWERAEIDANLSNDALSIRTKNISAFTVSLPANLLSKSINIDGDKLANPSGTRFSKRDGKWRNGAPEFASGLHKRHGLTGPIDDAFMDSFIFVRPTGKPQNEIVGTWADNELNRAITEWHRVFRGNARVKNDSDITPEDMANSNLILWGDPGSNRLLAKMLPNLPLKWTADKLTLGTNEVSAADHAPILIYPNPLNHNRYVVINSSFTFREGSTTSNSLQTPKLPDWAIVDLRTKPSIKWPGLITTAGFFDEEWRVAP
jgi:hypothetical protein